MFTAASLSSLDNLGAEVSNFDWIRDWRDCDVIKERILDEIIHPIPDLSDFPLDSVWMRDMMYALALYQNQIERIWKGLRIIRIRQFWAAGIDFDSE